MSEIKSIKDLNPINNIPVEEEVKDESIVLEETENNEETAESVDEVEEKEVREYIDEDEDTTFGSGLDFGDSISRRRKFLVERVEEEREKLAEEELEEEINQYEYDDIEDENDLFGDEEEDISVEDDDIHRMRRIDKPSESSPVSKKEEVKKSTSIKEAATNVTEDFPSQSSLFIDDEDYDSDDEEDGDVEDDTSLDEIKKTISDKLKSTEKALDISGFSVSATALSVNTILNEISNEESFDWVLMSSGKNISMKSFSGTDIETLAGGSSRNRFNTMKNIYLTIYNHIIGDKPSFEEWLKVIPFTDIPHLHMAIYKASFSDANYVPYECTNAKCGNIFLSDNIEIMDMLKFKDDDAKAKFDNIINNIDLTDPSRYETRIIPITNDIAIGFREPSIFNTIFENVILDQKFVDKYSDILGVMVYIDNIYYIGDGQLIPVGLKTERNKLAKNTKAKIVTYTKILNALPSDGFGKIRSIITGINAHGEELVYQIPETNCPKCGTLIEAEVTEVDQMLFGRHQLVGIANS